MRARAARGSPAPYLFSSPDDQPGSAHGSPANTRGRVRPAKSMLTEDKANRLHNFSAQSQHSQSEYSFHAMHKSATEKLVVDAAMFPETDEISTIFSDTAKLVFKRRLVDRVLRHWTEMARGQGFPRLDQIEPSKQGVDWANLLRDRCAITRLALIFCSLWSKPIICILS
jgi:hypothetical protein